MGVSDESCRGKGGRASEQGEEEQSECFAREGPETDRPPRGKQLAARRPRLS